MKCLKLTMLGLSLALFLPNLSAQQTNAADSLLVFSTSFEPVIKPTPSLADLKQKKRDNTTVLASGNSKMGLSDFPLQNQTKFPSEQWDKSVFQLKSEENSFFFANRRNRYSTLWTFASLNYLYADLVGLMDKNILGQYQNGTVNGTKITPTFLTVAAGFMQIPLCNVFLPQIIKNERTLRWVQIASGTVMTLVQLGTLFMGKPSPHYLLFSTVEIGTTAYITIDAIKWKAKKRVKITD